MQIILYLYFLFSHLMVHAAKLLTPTSYMFKSESSMPEIDVPIYSVLLFNASIYQAIQLKALFVLNKALYYEINCLIKVKSWLINL